MKNFYLQHKKVITIAGVSLYVLAVVALILSIIFHGFTMFELHFFGFLYLFLQLFLCYKARNLILKLFPVFPIFPFLALALLGYMESSMGGGIVMIFAIVMASICAFAVALAWLIYFISCKIKTRKKAEGISE